jgi:hypothetical protein
MSEQAAFEKIVPWLEENARFSLVVLPCEIQLALTSDQGGNKKSEFKKEVNVACSLGTDKKRKANAKIKKDQRDPGDIRK